MACFVVPAGEAVVTTIAEKVMKKKEKETEVVEVTGRIPFSRKLKWLNHLLWGGSALLAFEHVWHGEVVPWFPFLTAAYHPEEMAGVLHEMATAGVAMALLVTAVWGVMVAVATAMEKKNADAVSEEAAK